MKKIFAALILSAMVTVSFTACSSGSSDSPLNSIKSSISEAENSKADTSNTSEASKEISTSSKSSSNKQYATLDEFIKSDDGKKIIDSTQNTAGDMMDFALLAENKNLVYQFKYTEMMDGDGSYFSDYLKSYESTYKSSAKYVADIVDVDDPHIVLRYLNSDGTLIYEAEFDKNGSVNEIINSDESNTSKENSSSTSNSITSDGKYATIDDFINSDLANQIVESTQSSAGDVMDFELTSENGTKLVYLYKYTEQVDVDPDYFSKSMDNYKDTYASTVKYFKGLVSFENPTVILKYVNADGSLIYSAEFDENGLVKETKG